MRFSGVDGCKAGWIAAIADSTSPGEARLRVVTRFADLFEGPDAPDIVAVDMPIGLPDWTEGGGRGPEQAARAVLGSRRGSVFSIPSRDAVYAIDRELSGMNDIALSHKFACEVARRTSSRTTAFSRQAFMIFPKIREIDRLLRGDGDLRERVKEIHPELAFWSMNGQRPLRFPKKDEAGRAERVLLLESQGLCREAMFSRPPKGAAADDVLDALAALVVARHIAAGRGKPFPDPPGRDSHGLPITIWSFAPGR